MRVLGIDWDIENAAMREKDLERIRKFRLIDDEFMGRVFDDRKDCADLLLRLILGREDMRTIEVQTKKSISNLHGYSIQLDIYAKDTEGKLYDIEIQRSDEGAIPRRARYYSAMLDTNILKKEKKQGEDEFSADSGYNIYKKLPETYVIFITENDVLKEGRAIYHIDKVIRESGNKFDDGFHLVYVNGNVRDDTPLGKLMHDFFCTDADDMYYEILAEQVRHHKESKEGVRNMCRELETMRREYYQKGETRGEARGEVNTSKKLAIKMAGRGDSVEQIAEFVEYDVPTVKAWLAEEAQSKYSE
jgi:hypothetical protein